MRLFIAVELDDSTRDALHRALRHARAATDKARWIQKASWHFTLQFLGEVTEDRVAGLARALGEVGLRHAPFTLTLGGAGAFPDERSARVIWVGVGRGAEALGALAADVVQANAPLGFVPEGRPFQPHLTVARQKRAVSARRVLEAMDVPPLELHVGAAVLFRSHLTHEGARYEPLARAPLLGAPDG